MIRYLDAIGWMHTVLGALGTVLGAALTAIPIVLALYGLFDFVYGLLFLMVGPQYIPYAIEELVQMLALSAVIAAPALLLLAAFIIELVAGVGLLRRWRRARTAGLVACGPALAMGLPGILLGVGTVVVLNDDEVKAALHRA